MSAESEPKWIKTKTEYIKAEFAKAFPDAHRAIINKEKDEIVALAMYTAFKKGYETCEEA